MFLPINVAIVGTKASGVYDNRVKKPNQKRL